MLQQNNYLMMIIMKILFAHKTTFNVLQSLIIIYIGYNNLEQQSQRRREMTTVLDSALIHFKTKKKQVLPLQKLQEYFYNSISLRSRGTFVIPFNRTSYGGKSPVFRFSKGGNSRTLENLMLPQS
jgi:hypothetical protein